MLGAWKLRKRKLDECSNIKEPLCWVKEYLKINAIQFCRDIERGEKTEGAVLHPNGIKSLLTQAEVMRLLTVLEMTGRRSTSKQPCAGEKLRFSLDMQVKERGAKDGSSVSYLKEEGSR